LEALFAALNTDKMKMRQWGIPFLFLSICTQGFAFNCLLLLKISDFLKEAAQGKKNEEALAKDVLEHASEEGTNLVELVGRDRIEWADTKETKKEITYTLEIPLENSRIHTIVVHIEKTKDGGIYYDYQEMLDLISALPLRTIQATGEITFPAKDPMGNADFKNNKVGGQATPGHIFLYPQKSAVSSLYDFIHEHGHNFANYIYQKWFIQQNSEPGRAYRAAMKEDPYSPSEYGDTNPAEDFAEAFVKYVQSKAGTRNSNIRYRWPRRCAVLDRFFSKEFGSLDDEFFNQLRSYYRLQALKTKAVVAGSLLVGLAGAGTFVYYQVTEKDKKKALEKTTLSSP